MFYSKKFDNGIIKDNLVVNCENTNILGIKLLLINKEKYNIDLYKYNYIDIIYNDNIDVSLLTINKNNISSNLGKIEEKKGNISSNLGKIEENKGNISCNLINMRLNEDNIAINLTKIKELNQNKTYLKNLENILFYDKNTQVDFKGTFFEKIFKVTAKQINFIELNLKILLEYEDMSQRIYVNTYYEIFDENNNSLYISSINNNDYQYFSNKVFVEEKIFYNSAKNVKNIKFKIKFVMTAEKVKKNWYIKNDNYRFILKHYSL